jgi:hypothetical protein
VTCLTGFVGWGASDSLDAVLAPTEIPCEFDFLSIDVDGNDFHVWNAVIGHRPKVVCVEFNPTMHVDVAWVQPANPRRMVGASLTAMVRLGTEKGYELVCVTTTNAIFVRRELFPRVGVGDNSPGTLWTDDRYITHIFTGQDGRVVLTGRRMVHWHDLPLSESRVQQLPRFLRRYPDNYSRLQFLLFRIYRKWRRFLYRRETRDA